MAENKNHSLIVRPGSAVEKAAPGAKRILSGMVAETLALVKKESPVKPVVSVLVVGGVVDSYAELFEAAFRAFLSDQYDLRIVAADNAVEVLRLAQQRPFDLFIAILNNVWQGLNEIRLDPPDGGTWGDRISFLTRLKKQFGKPIIAMSGLAEMGFEERARRAGADAFFLLPFEMENLLAAVQSCLKIQRVIIENPVEIAPQSRKTRPLRIVVVDDDDDWLKLVETMIQDWFKDAETVTFNSSEAALRELEQRDPDLLITGDKMPRMTGEELVRRLIAKNVNYPILVLTGHDEAQQWVREYADRGYNIKFVSKTETQQELKPSIEVLLTPQRGKKAEPAEIARQLHNEQPQRIVIVDDESAVLRSIEIMIRRRFENITLLLFEDPVEAWRNLSETNPDLLITNFVMPRLSGDELLRRLAQKQVSYPVILTSGYFGSASKEVQGCMNLGMKVSFLAKPFTSSMFLNLVENGLGIKRDSER